MSNPKKVECEIELVQWFQNGDHPEDHSPIGIENPSPMTRERYEDYLSGDGKVIKPFKSDDIDPQSVCSLCRNKHRFHGMITTDKGQIQIVCPGDWVITKINVPTSVFKFSEPIYGVISHINMSIKE